MVQMPFFLKGSDGEQTLVQLRQDMNVSNVLVNITFSNAFQRVPVSGMNLVFFLRLGRGKFVSDVLQDSDLRCTGHVGARVNSHEEFGSLGLAELLGADHSHRNTSRTLVTDLEFFFLLILVVFVCDGLRIIRIVRIGGRLFNSETGTFPLGIETFTRILFVFILRNVFTTFALFGIGFIFRLFALPRIFSSFGAIETVVPAVPGFAPVAGVQLTVSGSVPNVATARARFCWDLGGSDLGRLLLRFTVGCILVTANSSSGNSHLENSVFQIGLILLAEVSHGFFIRLFDLPARLGVIVKAFLERI